MLIAVAALPCATCRPVTVTIEPQPVFCRAAVPVAVRWIAPEDQRDKRELSAWCDAVGPPEYHTPASADGASSRSLTVVSWNTGVGRGRLVEFANDLRMQHPGSDLVLLIQEAYRSEHVPANCSPGSRGAARIEPRNETIVAAARALRMHAIYIPSMRNGERCGAGPAEDRGNAILSTVPIQQAAAIELPFAQQRRVAVAASVRMGSRDVWVVSAHFDTSLTAHKRQADGLIGALDALVAGEPLIVGGDLNGPWLDPGVIAMRRHLPEVACGDEPTHDFPALRLDHMFARGDVSVAKCVTGSRSYGSDHWPLLARIQLNAETPQHHARD